MYPETKIRIEQIAKEYDCLYGGNPSISELLIQIHSGRLVISKATNKLLSKQNNSSIAFRIEVPRYLAGSIAIVSQKIAEHEGNIASVKNRSRNSLGILEVFLSIPPESNLADLITELESIKVKQVAHLNEIKELQAIATEFEFQLVGGRRRVTSLDDFLEKKLISNMACVIGFELIAKDEVGLLAKIANQIAQSKLLIYSISENIGEEMNEAVIKLFLYLRPSAESTIVEQIEKIDYVIKQLKTIEEVKSVARLGVDSLD